MKLNEIGERMLTYFITDKFLIKFDDCALIDVGDEYLVITTDMVNNKMHFPKGTTYYQIGWYSIAVNVSDVVAMGATPFAYLSAFGLPADMEYQNYLEIVRGMEDGIKKLGGDLIGGDTKQASEIVISVTALGKVKKENVMLRVGAKAGDSVYVTGTLGNAGTALLEKDISNLLNIIPKVKEAKILAESKKVSCCMDISDGLVSSLYQLSKLNNVGFRIFKEAIPLGDIAKKTQNPYDLALYSGGDFVLLFTVSRDEGKNLEKIIDIVKIGEVITDKRVVINSDGNDNLLEDKGFEHFKNKNYPK